MSTTAFASGKNAVITTHNGPRKIAAGHITLGTDYAAGGLAITAANVGLREGIDELTLGGCAGFIPYWNRSTGKLQVYDPTTGAECGNSLADLDGVIVSFIAWGY